MKKIIIIILSVILALVLSCIIWYKISLRAVSKESNEVNFVIESGTSANGIINKLKDANLIRNPLAAKIYMHLKTKQNFQAGTYNLNRNMSVLEIFKVLSLGGKSGETIHLTFIEGKTLEEYLKDISIAFNLNYEDILKEINTKEFLEPLIEKYWFLNKDILTKDVYYYLEGYLFPNTYEFYQKSSLKNIIMKMLDETEKKLNSLKEEIRKSNLSVHEILTISSIIEKEAVKKEDRAYVSQVIYTRLAQNMNLGMDVTTYYGVKKNLKEALTKADLNNVNPYNTRLESFVGLPAGPICNASLESIEASLNPASTNYVYFYADTKTGKIYFTADYKEFLTFKEIYK